MIKKNYKMKTFKKYKINDLNKIKGGVKDTTWTSNTTGWKYKDYKYNDNEVNETNSTPDCTAWGGLDKTFELAN